MIEVLMRTPRSELMRSASRSSQSISARLVILLNRDLKKPAMRREIEDARRESPEARIQNSEKMLRRASSVLFLDSEV